MAEAPVNSPAIRRLPFWSKATDVGWMGFEMATAVIELPNWLLPGWAIRPAVPVPAMTYTSPAVRVPFWTGVLLVSMLYSFASEDPAIRYTKTEPAFVEAMAVSPLVGLKAT